MCLPGGFEFQVDSNGDFHRYQGKRYRKTGRFSRIVLSAEVSSEFRWYHGHIVRPKHFCLGRFFCVWRRTFPADSGPIGHDGR